MTRIDYRCDGCGRKPDLHTVWAYDADMRRLPAGWSSRVQPGFVDNRYCKDCTVAGKRGAR